MKTTPYIRSSKQIIIYQLKTNYVGQGAESSVMHRAPRNIANKSDAFQLKSSNISRHASLRFIVFHNQTESGF